MWLDIQSPTVDPTLMRSIINLRQYEEFAWRNVEGKSNLNIKNQHYFNGE